MLDVAMLLLVSSSTEAVQEPPCSPPPAVVCVFVDSPAFPARRVSLFCIYAYAVWRWNEGGMLNKQIYMSMHNGRWRSEGRVLAGLWEEGRKYKRMWCRGTPALKDLGESCRGTLWQAPDSSPPPPLHHLLLVGTFQEVWHAYVSLPCPRGDAARWHRLDGSAECGTDSPVGNPLLHSRFFSHRPWMDGNCDCVNGHFWIRCGHCSFY